VRPAGVRAEELVDQEAPRALAAARERVEDEQLRRRVGTTCRPHEPSTPDVVDTSAPERECAGDRLQHRGFEEPLLVAGHPEGPVANAARRRGCGAGRRTGVSYGISTLLTTWMTPFDALTSAVVTRAPPTDTLPPVTRIETDLPLSVLAERSVTTLAAGTLPLTTW